MQPQQGDALLNEPMSAFPAGPETGGGDNRVAMDLGNGPDKKPKKGSRRRKEWTCEPDFQKSQGVVPHNIKFDPLNEWDLEWQDYDPRDEVDGDTYSDLILPSWWPNP